jgi:amino acid transporter
VKTRQRSSKRVARAKAVAAFTRSLLLAAALLIAYTVAPLSGSTDGVRLVVLVVGLVVVGLLMSLGVRSIVESATPRIRAIEVLLTIMPLFLISFASTYVAMSQQNSGAFSTSLSRVGALYLTVTVFSTVGFGDIVPMTDAARIVVMVQMIGDLVLIGAGVRILLGAVQVGLERKSGASPSTPDRPSALDDGTSGTGRLGATEELGER